MSAGFASYGAWLQPLFRQFLALHNRLRLFCQSNGQFDRHVSLTE
jgi:hypothetical protein